jgi:hypothetical protein
MAGQITMILWRDLYSEPGSIEYSWVPEGVPHTISLPEQQQEGSRADPAPGHTAVSHVQVYRLTNGRWEVGDWQFPPGPPYKSPVIAAIIQILELRKEVIGTVHYADGTTASAQRRIDE